MLLVFVFRRMNKYLKCVSTEQCGKRIAHTQFSPQTLRRIHFLIALLDSCQIKKQRQRNCDTMCVYSCTVTAFYHDVAAGLLCLNVAEASHHQQKSSCAELSLIESLSVATHSFFRRGGAGQELRSGNEPYINNLCSYLCRVTAY